MKQTENEKIPPIVYLVALTAALAGLLFGLDIGVISGVVPFLQDAFGIGTVTKELVVSAILFGAIFGTILSGYVSKKFGRKNAIIVSSLIFAVGSILVSAATSAAILIAVRFFLGIALGIASFTAPLYLSEMAPKRIRGALISLYQLMITIGIVLAFISDSLLAPGGHWRLMLGVLLIPSALMFLGVAMLPKSPRWLAMRKRKDEAVAVLKKLRSSAEEVQNEFKDIEERLMEEPKSGITMLKEKPYRKVIILGIILQAAQQFTGMNVIMYYAPEIFKEVGFSTATEQMWGTVIVGLVNVFATFIAIAFVDKMGRKPILYAGYSIMAICMGALGLAFHIGIDHHLIQFMALASLLIFIVGFAMSAGPIIWVVCSEIYPLKGRDFGITVSTATNWTCNTVIGMTFLTLIAKIGSANTYWLYALINFAVIFILFFLVPETKGVSLEDIESNLESGKKLKNLGI